MAPRPRHVVWITTDHMRYDHIAAHGSPHLHTPELDRLVAGGVSFERCYAQNPVCMPSRCSFMTGLYPPQSQVMDNGQELDPACPTTVARCFGSAYQTAQIGKLHFQAHEDNDLDPRARHDYGFDIFWSSEEPGCYEDAYLTWLRGAHPELVPLFVVPRSASFERGAAEAPRVIDAPWQASYSGWVADQFDRYMGTWGGRRTPQFLHLGFYAPHPPLNPTGEMFEPYRDRALPPRQRRDDEAADKPEPLAGMLGMCAGWDEARFDAYRRHFAAMVTGVDLAIGRIRRRLEDLGVWEDTLLVFGSDHGDMCGDHDMIVKQPSFYEGVMRLPWVLHWPAGLGPEPRRVGGLVEMVDVLPTLLELSALPVPAAMAGRSWAEDLLAGREPAGREDVLAIHGPGHCMLRSQEHKYLRYVTSDGPAEVLYDLREDPGEFVNRAADPACGSLLERLRQRAFDRCLEASRSPRPRHYRF